MNISTERHDRAAAPPRAIVLRVTLGPDAGTEVALQMNERLLVGSSQTCALRLTDRRVSRRHLALEQTPAGLVVRDLGSTNGTFVRGVEVREAVVRPGDAIELGESQMVAVDAATPGPLPAEADSFGRLVGRSVEMRRLFALAPKLAQASASLLIEGETGTGKELFAEEIHAQGARSGGPLYVFSALSEDPQTALVTLFGSVAGAAGGDRPGLLELAHGGTLILDEPGELNADLQRRLGRALSRGQAQRVGSNAPYSLDVRVISTSTANLDRAVERGLFREELFYALVGARIELPPLRKRPEDVTVLARHFWSALKVAGELPLALVAHLEAHPWPGNVRELENAISRHLATGELDVGASARPTAPPKPNESGPDVVTEILSRHMPLVQARQEIVVRFEQMYLEQVLREHNGNVTRAARASGLAHRYFQALKARRSR
ncbi:MAG: sigma 54-dependent Fis family transcriptional regulator [Myxococcales bacterium]|nr:sigma 54-dependent Fis family transcriptional regulator [Myxococcales bacterium]